MTIKTLVGYTLGTPMLAKLYVTNHPKAPFLVRYTDPTRRDGSGRALRVPKRFAQRESAEKYQADLNKRLQVVGTSGLVFDHQLRAQALSAKQKLQSAGVRLSIDAIVDRYVQELPSKIGADLDARAALNEYLDVKGTGENRSANTVTDIEERVLRWFNAEGIVVMNDITPEAARHVQMRKGKHPKTRANDMSACNGFCEWACKRKMLGMNPFSELEFPHIERGKPKAWTNHEAREILHAAEVYRGGYWMPAVIVALFAGVRPSEMPQVRVILKGLPRVRVEGGKLRGRANRIVPLSPNAVELLRRYPPKKDGSVQPITTRGRKAIARLAGVDWWADAPRHTFISNRIAVVHHEGKVAREAGNSPDVIFKHYVDLRTPAEARVFWGLRPARKKCIRK